MTRIILNLNKSVEENASDYFEKSKKAKSKLEGAKEALMKTKIMNAPFGRDSPDLAVFETCSGDT